MSEGVDNKESVPALPSFGSVFVAGARNYGTRNDSTNNNHSTDDVTNYLASAENVARNALCQSSAAADSPRNSSPDTESIGNHNGALSQDQLVGNHSVLPPDPPVSAMDLATAISLPNEIVQSGMSLPTEISQMYPLNLSDTSTMHVATRNYLLGEENNGDVEHQTTPQSTPTKIQKMYTSSISESPQNNIPAHGFDASESPRTSYPTSSVSKPNFTPSPDANDTAMQDQHLNNDYSTSQSVSSAIPDSIAADSQALMATQNMYGGMQSFSETALRNYAASISALARNYPMFDQNYTTNPELAKDFTRNSLISAEHLIRRYLAAARGSLGQTGYAENQTAEGYQSSSQEQMSPEQKLQTEMAAFSAAMGIPYHMTNNFLSNNMGQNDQPLGLTTSGLDNRGNNISALSPTASQVLQGGSDENLVADLSIKSEPDPYLCKACHESFPTTEMLELHMKRHSGDKPYECTHCHKKFAIQSRLKYHIRKHESPLQCTVCGKQFIEKFDLAVHMNIHNTGDNQFTCEFCQEVFDSATSLQFHRKIHDGVQSLKCSTCEASFTQYADLQRHLKVHSSMIVVTCPQCDGRIPREKYEVHARQCGKDRIWKCRRCKTCFASQPELVAHREVHKDDKPFLCPICHKRFSHKCNLDVHNRTHTGERPYTCTYCGKKFAQSGTLKAHVRTHTGEKPYVCDFCQKAFAVKANLDAHRRIHTGERPYKCDKCGMRFSQSNTLKSHRKTHT